MKTTKRLFAEVLLSCLFNILAVFCSESGARPEKKENHASMGYGAFSPSPKNSGESLSLPLVPAEDGDKNLDVAREMDQEALLPLARWVKNDIIDPSPVSRLERGAGILGMTIGLLASYASAPLAGEFGVFLWETVGGPEPGVGEAVYVIFALNAILPAMALNAVGAKHQLQAFARAFLKEPEIKVDKKLEVINGTAHFLGFFSGISLGYVAYQVTRIFPLPLAIAFTSSSYVGRYMFTLEAQKKLFKSLFNYGRRGEDVKEKCQALQEGFLKSMKAVSQMEEQELEERHEAFFSKPEGSATETGDQDSLHKIRDLLRSGDASPLPPLSSRNRIAGKAAQMAGGMIGSTEVHITFMLAQGSIQLLSGAAGIEDPLTQNYLGKACAVIACIPWACLYAEGVSSSFSGIYQSVFHKDRRVQKEFTNPKARRAVAIYSAVGGMFTALPAVQLAMQTTEGLPLGLRFIMGGITFLCTSTVFTQALDAMLSQGLGWIKSFRGDSTDMRREKLIQAAQTLSLGLEDLPDAMTGSLCNQGSLIPSISLFPQENNAGDGFQPDIEDIPLIGKRGQVIQDAIA